MTAGEAGFGLQMICRRKMLNHGIPAVQQELEKNGNGQAVFTIGDF